MMGKVNDEICSRCGKVISSRAIAHVADDKIFCSACRKKIDSQRAAEIRRQEAVAEAQQPYCFPSKVAGVAHEMRQWTVLKCCVGEVLLLARDFANSYSPHAVMVLRSDGSQVGFLPDRTAMDLAGAMDRFGVTAIARVEQITGGTRDKPTTGLNIMVFVNCEPY